MKRIKTIVTMLVVAAMLVLLPNNSLEASAAEPVTYAVKYVADEQDWRFQSNTSTFDETKYHRELYYMYESMKDGDIVVVYNDSADAPELDLGSARLSNLTVVQSDYFTVIHANGIDVCYVLNGTACSINSDVTNAYVYDYVTCNFNKNVQNLTIYKEDVYASVVGCTGTVQHLHVQTPDESYTYFHLYDFQKETFQFADGELKSPTWAYSWEPSQTSTQQPAGSTSTGSTSSSSGEYDDVPKTGENPIALWLVCAAALCMTGSLYLKKKAS